MFKRSLTLSAAAMLALVVFLAVTFSKASAADHPREFLEGVAGTMIELAIESAEAGDDDADIPAEAYGDDDDDGDDD